jgi:hypothetical protein
MRAKEVALEGYAEQEAHQREHQSGFRHADNTEGIIHAERTRASGTELARSFY